jgi:hypothetical protein
LLGIFGLNLPIQWLLILGCIPNGVLHSQIWMPYVIFVFFVSLYYHMRHKGSWFKHLGQHCYHTCLLYWEESSIMSLYYNYENILKAILFLMYVIMSFFFANFYCMVARKEPSVNWTKVSFGRKNAKVVLLKQWVPIDC